MQTMNIKHIQEVSPAASKLTQLNRKNSRILQTLFRVEANNHTDNQRSQLSKFWTSTHKKMFQLMVSATGKSFRTAMPSIHPPPPHQHAAKKLGIENCSSAFPPKQMATACKKQ